MPHEALALAAARFGLLVEDCLKYCLPAWTGLTIWGDPIPDGNDVKDFIRAKGVDPHAISRDDVAKAKAYNRTMSAARAAGGQVPEVQMGVFKITKESAVKLLQATGLKNAANYDDKRLLQKLQAYQDVDEDKRGGVSDPPLVKLQSQLMLALARADEVRLDTAAPAKAKPEEEPEAAVPEKPKKPVKAPPVKAKPAAHSEPEPEKGPKAKPAKAGAPDKSRGRGVGINVVMLDMLRKATPAKPVTKDQIHDKLKKEFPERDEAAMRGTINYYIPGYFSRGGYVIGSSDKGFWMAKDKK